jgi:ABC-type nickel/cobalt efflux system permease component RcnA
MEVGLIMIFWYGLLHAFGPDHLTAIADFSIGKSLKKTMTITLMFAIGHGVMLFLFAKLMQMYLVTETMTAYGDMISSSVIIAMGLYLIYMVATDRIQLNRHMHEKREHIHIYFGKKHSHSMNSTSISALGLGALMGIGGVRGMLVTLGMLNGTNVEWYMILAFVAGVSLVFVSFGVLILYFNKKMLTNLSNVRRTFMVAGVVSVAVGTNMLLA